MTEEYRPKHVRPYSELREKNIPVREGRHKADRYRERLGANAFEDLEAEMFTRRSTALGSLLWDTCVAPRLAVTR